jgi:hypothetical protein
VPHTPLSGLARLPSARVTIHHETWRGKRFSAGEVIPQLRLVRGLCSAAVRPRYSIPPPSPLPSACLPSAFGVYPPWRAASALRLLPFSSSRRSSARRTSPPAKRATVASPGFRPPPAEEFGFLPFTLHSALCIPHSALVTPFPAVPYGHVCPQGPARLAFLAGFRRPVPRPARQA